MIEECICFSLFNLIANVEHFVESEARNLTEEERKGYKEVTWDSKEVCSFYMVRFCPHDLFVNTRSDLGAFAVSVMYLSVYLLSSVVADLDYKAVHGMM